MKCDKIGKNEHTEYITKIQFTVNAYGLCDFIVIPMANAAERNAGCRAYHTDVSHARLR